MSKLFGRFVEAESEGFKVDLPNGILIHGKSNERNSEFLYWLTKKIPVIFDSKTNMIKHNPDKPLDTIGAIMDQAKVAKEMFAKTKKRTLIFVQDLDKMLTDYSTSEKRGDIGVFNGFVEHLSKEYKATLVMKTSKSLDDFELASIGDNRFELKVPINKGLSEKQAKRLENFETEVKRLDDKAGNCNDKYYKEDYDSSSSSTQEDSPFDILGSNYQTWY